MADSGGGHRVRELMSRGLGGRSPGERVLSDPVAQHPPHTLQEQLCALSNVFHPKLTTAFR